MPGTEATVSGLLTFKNNTGKLSTTGTIRMDNVVVQSKPMGFPIELNYNASDDWKAGILQVSNTQLKLGSAPFVINGTVNGKSSPALADLKLNTQNASLVELVKLFEAFGVVLSPAMEPSGDLSADLTARGPLSAPALAGTLRLSQLKLRGLMASALQINLNLATSGFAAPDLAASNLSAPELVRTKLARALIGKVSVNLNDGKLTGVDMAQQLGAIGRFTGLSKVADGSTHVSEMTGDFNLKNGLASTDNLKALTDAGTIAVTGTASLTDQQLDMKATAVLSRTSSQRVGGNSIGGLMNTAIANQNGEIVVPVLVTGTIPNPKLSPDVSTMARMRFNNLLPSFGNPEQLTQRAQGTLSGGVNGTPAAISGNTPGAAASNQQQEENVAQNPSSGLGRFTRKKTPAK
jgi:hypothetical protein